MAGTLREITVQELSDQILASKQFAILDVRETWELSYAHLVDARIINIPMSRIGHSLREAFPAELQNPETEIVVMCHHGIRSANVAVWMMQNGWQNVTSLAGGINAYALEIDASVGQY
jgi:rhodanese-related sulfurtransferase